MFYLFVLGFVLYRCHHSTEFLALFLKGIETEVSESGSGARVQTFPDPGSFSNLCPIVICRHHTASRLPSPRRLLGDCSRLPCTNAESLIALFTVVFSGLLHCVLLVTGVVADFWLAVLVGADFACQAQKLLIPNLLCNLQLILV